MLDGYTVGEKPGKAPLEARFRQIVKYSRFQGALPRSLKPRSVTMVHCAPAASVRGSSRKEETVSDPSFVLLSFEGPDRYSRAGGLGSRVTELSRALAGMGFETHLF